MTRLRVVRANEAEYERQQPAHALAEAALALVGSATLWREVTQDFPETRRAEFLVAMIAGLASNLPRLRESVQRAAKVRKATDADWHLCLTLLRRELREAK